MWRKKEKRLRTKIKTKFTALSVSEKTQFYFFMKVALLHPREKRIKFMTISPFKLEARNKRGVFIKCICLEL